MVSSSRGLNSELLCVLGVQSLPAGELHHRGTNDAAEGGSAQQVIQHIEANVPPGSTHGDEAAIDVGPQRQARAAAEGFELPAHIEATPVVLEHLGSVGSRHCGFGHVQRGRSHRGELHRGSNRTEAPIGVEGRPLAQLRWVGQRLPDFFWRVTQLSDENERPLLSVLSHLRPAGRTRCVLLAIDHLPSDAYRPEATKADSSPITTAQTIGLVAASLSEYRAYSPARARVSSASAPAASGVRIGIHCAAAGTTSRTAPSISSTPSARHPPRESARMWFASWSNLNTLYAPPEK